MGNARGIGIIFAGVAIAGAFGLPADAGVYKSTVGGNKIYITALAANASAQIVTTANKTSAVLADSCGRVKVSKPVAGFTTLSVNGAAITVASLPVAAPTCTSGVLSPAQTVNYKDAAGNVFVVGRPAASANTVSMPGTSTKNAIANACGFAVFNESASAPFSAFTVGATSYTFSALTATPGSGVPLKCTNVGTTAAPNYKILGFVAVP